MNLVEGLYRELLRNKMMLKVYEELPDNAGAFGAIGIRNAIEHGESALFNGDPSEMAQCYASLKETK